MAYDAKPSTWLGAGYSLASNAITMNTNDAGSNKTLTELTDAEANATTGDVRKLFYALVEKMYAAYMAQASADRPTKMAIVRSTSINDTAGSGVRSYTFTFYLDTGTDPAFEVTDES